MEGIVTYRHCAFLGDRIAIRGFQGNVFHVCKCTHPKSPWRACPSSYSDTKKHTDDACRLSVCRLFRAKSVMNSFDAGKEGNDG